MTPRPAIAAAIAALIAIAIAASVTACRGEPPAKPPYAPVPVVELQRWQIWDGERQLGVLRHLEIRQPNAPIRYYSIEDLQRRVVGSATDNGRFTRRVPFRDDEEDLGVWSLPRGVAQLFEASAPVELRAVAQDADARATDRPR